MGITFATRLRAVAHRGNLTMADLSRWFERPYSTVKQWANGGNVALPPLDQQFAWKQLERLESFLDYPDKRLPVPKLLSRRLRKTYLQALKEGKSSCPPQPPSL